MGRAVKVFEAVQPTIRNTAQVSRAGQRVGTNVDELLIKVWRKCFIVMGVCGGGEQRYGK